MVFYLSMVFIIQTIHTNHFIAHMNEMTKREREEDDTYNDLEDVDLDAIMDKTDGSQEELLP